MGFSGGSDLIRVLLLLCSWDLSHALISYSISEEVGRFTMFGNLAKDFNIDVRSLVKRSLQILGGDEGYFDVNLKTGELFVINRLDREELCKSTQKCTLKFQVIAENPLIVDDVEVTVADINDNAPVFPLQKFVKNVSENARPGERFSVPAARDLDVGINSVKSYKLNHNEYFSLVVQSYEQSVSAELELQKPLDREKQAVIKLTLTAVDGGKPAKSGTMDIIINVLDINDNNPVFSKTLYKVKIKENIAFGAKILTVAATDSDEGTNGEIMYSIVGQEGNLASRLFSINDVTGDITIKGNIDYEENPAIELRVQAQDKSISPRHSNCKVLIEIEDVNDNAPEISVTLLMNSVSEDIKPGADVALITVSDKDDGKNGKVACKIAGASPFKLQPSSKNSYSIVVNEPLDREQASQYNITVIASDEGSPSLSSTGNIVIDILDVNDNPPDISVTVLMSSLSEDIKPGAKVALITVSDKDDGKNGKVACKIAGASPFKLQPSSKNSYSLVVNEPLDREQASQYNITVIASDEGSPSLSRSTEMILSVSNINNNAPVGLGGLPMQFCQDGV